MESDAREGETRDVATAESAAQLVLVLEFVLCSSGASGANARGRRGVMEGEVVEEQRAGQQFRAAPAAREAVGAHVAPMPATCVGGLGGCVSGGEEELQP